MERWVSGGTNATRGSHRGRAGSPTCTSIDCSLNILADGGRASYQAVLDLAIGTKRQPFGVCNSRFKAMAS